MSVAHYFETMDYGAAPEADSEARAWLARHNHKFGHFIDESDDAEELIEFINLTKS